ncbi:MAG: 4-oxalomesaconate tautomerase [Proteobacteria bacterium]|uniref:4-oxalomesaconate tautomerase n=1 Tax=Piscinibacter sp. TaxID=1903157 RepID=UPI001B70B964|nr:4-oxalomesaconate tautomerase [Piscinibacter sp.]MBP6029197.1 4-oxalomesaconate tautomerase [Piscinibacter sp.]MBS0440998.1 4-oxalomesaconate tautomerase [Pseudomonadota bacterium]
MNRVIPCVLMRAGTSRGPFFLRDWLPADDAARDEALIGAIGASDLLQVDGVGGGSTLTSKVAIVSNSSQPDCDVDYLFAQVGVGQKSVDTRPNCGNMLSGVAPFAIEQGLVTAQDGETTVRVFNVNTRSRIDVTVQTPGRRVTYAGDTGIDGVAGTAAPIRLNFLDAWGSVTGSLFPTGQRIDRIEGLDVTCIDAAMPLVIMRARDLGLSGRETPADLDADRALLERIETVRRAAGAAMGLGDVSGSVVPKPVIASAGADEDSITSRYFTPRRCHASHAVTGAIGVATAFALPGTVASSERPTLGQRRIAVLHPQGRIEVDVQVDGAGDEARIQRAALVRTARKILQGDLHIPDYVFSKPSSGDTLMKPVQALRTAAAAAAVATALTAAPAAFAYPDKVITLVVPTAAGGGNDAMARTIAQKLGPLLGQTIIIDNRAGANGSIASEYVARAAPDGHTLMFGYIGTHAMNPALQKLRYDPVADFEPIGLVGSSPTLMVTNAAAPIKDVKDLVAQLKAKPDKFTYASAGNGTAPHYAAELFKLNAGVVMLGIPYKGSAPAVSDTIGGQTQVMFPSLFTALPHVKSGKLKAMAVAGPKRSALLPDVPTMKEAGVEGVEVEQWYGLFAPAKTPKAIVDQINKALNQVLADKDIEKRIEDHGADVQGSTPAQLGALVKSELAKWKSVVQRAKLTAD